MLKPAYLYSDQLKRKYAEAMSDNYFNFYNSNLWSNYALEIQDNDCWTIQRVSIDSKGNVIGYMSTSIDRDSRVISCFGIMNFTKSINPVFAKDLLVYIRELRDVQKASKFEFCAYEDGKPEKMYRKFIAKHGGRIVGKKTNSVKLKDGEYHNAILFEIMRKDMNF